MLRNPVTSSKKKELYLLTVYVKRAFGLKNMEVLNFSDAFVVLEFRGQTFETPIVQNNLEPWWDQSFQFVIELTEGESATDAVMQELIKLRVFDHNKVLKNELIGCFFFKVN